MDLNNGFNNFFRSRKCMKLLNNLDWTTKLLLSKNEIHYHKRFERLCLKEGIKVRQEKLKKSYQ